MRAVRRFPWMAGAVAGLLLVAFAGCDSTDDGDGPVSADVYGDFGYVEPWYYPSAWFGEGGGYYYGGLPYDRGYRPAERGRAGPGPQRGHAAPGGGNRAIPSIPNQARPGPSMGGGRGGGGGGVRGGGGGGGNRRP